MARKVYCILLCFFFLFSSGCAQSQPENKTDTQSDTLTANISADYRMTDSSIVNPYMGFAVDATSKIAAAQYSLVYIDITFRELQPKGPESFDFEAIASENHIEQWKSEGKHAVLRFVCDIPRDSAHMDIPDWLYQLTGDGTFYDTSYGKGYSPDYSNEVFIQYHKAAVKALGEYFSDEFVAFVELGSLGHWGEWHVKRESGIVGMPESAVREEYVKHYIEAFDHAKIMMRRPFTNAKKYGLGLYNDMAGDPEATEEWLGWIEEGGTYTQTGEKNALVSMPDFWKKAPAGGELTSSLSMEYLCGTGLSETVSLLQQSHTTFIGPKCPVSSSNKYDSAVYRNAVSEMIGALGYRIGITRMTVKQSQEPSVYQVELQWKNEGVAPLYFDLPVKLYLTDQERTEEIADVDIALTQLLPGTTVKTVTSLPRDTVLSGTTISVGILDHMTGCPAVRLVSDQEYLSNGSAQLYCFS